MLHGLDGALLTNGSTFVGDKVFFVEKRSTSRKETGNAVRLEKAESDKVWEVKGK